MDNPDKYTEKQFEKLFDISENFLCSLNDALVRDKGKYRNLTCKHVHALIDFATMFNHWVDIDDYANKELAHDYDKLPVGSKLWIPKKIKKICENL